MTVNLRRRRVTVNGVSVCAAEAGHGGTPTVFLHGGGPGCTALSDFGPVLDAVRVGRHLVLLDLPQYGDSDAPPITGPVFDFHTAALAGALGALGVRRADFVCQSLGGSVALLLAARRPDLVRRIVVTGCQPVPPPTGISVDTGLARQLRASYYGGSGPTPQRMRALMAAAEWSDASAIPEKTVQSRYAASTTSGARALGLAHELRGAAQDLSPALAQVAAPVQLIWGEHDPFAGPDYARALADRLAQAKVAVLPRTAHHPQAERPAHYAELVQQFLTTEQGVA